MNTIDPLGYIEIPDFREFITKPNTPTCAVIKSTQLMVEVLGGMKPAQGEFNDSDFSSSLLLDGDFALVVRYHRKKDNTYRPACVLSFNIIEDGVQVVQLQGSTDRHVAFRFHSSFHIAGFFIRVLEMSFFQKGIPVTVDPFPKGLEGAPYASKSRERYELLRTSVDGLRAKYTRKDHIHE